MSVSVRSVLLDGPQRPRGPYTYASTPRALYNNAKLRKDPPCGGGAAYSNVMHERRVVRGSTCAPHFAAGDGGDNAARRKRALARRAARCGSPPAAPGRRHRPAQTERHLEELAARPAEAHAAVQTDPAADRPASPRYVPAATGADTATQLEPGDLFHFDTEVQPLLEALVGGTVRQALAEAAREEELATLREQQRRYCELRDAERAERARLAAQHARLHAEHERRVAEGRAAQDAAQEARGRVAAAALLRGYVADMLPSVLAGLREHAHLADRQRQGVEEELMPWLVSEVALEVEAIITSREVLAEIVRDVVEARAELRQPTRPCSPPDSVTPRSVSGLAEEESLLEMDE